MSEIDHTLTYIVLASFLSGCFYFGKDQFEDVVNRPSNDWSSRDCLTIMTSVMANNFTDQSSNIEVIATPYYPSVVEAISRLEQSKKHLSEAQFAMNMDTSLSEQLGLYLDRDNGRMINSRGYFVKDRTDIDSLSFLVTLRNRTWPCVPPLISIPTQGSGFTATQYVTVPLATMSDWPCYVPDISDLEQRISLMNEDGESLKPRFVWGRRNESLTTEETVIASFPLRMAHHHFLKSGKRMYLVIRGFEKEIDLPFSLSRMK